MHLRVDSKMPVARLAILVGALAAVACVQTTSPTDVGGGLLLSSSSGRPLRVTYLNDLQAVFASDCVRCHNVSSAAGGYSMNDYPSVLKAVRSGDPSSPLVVATQPTGRMFQYFSGDRLAKSSLVYIWIVEYDAGLGR